MIPRTLAQTFGGIGLAALLVSGCGKSDLPSPVSQKEDVQVDYQQRYVPVTSSEGLEVIEKTDFRNLVPNGGYLVDMNGDERRDFAILRGKTLYFSKGREDGSFEKEVPVLEVTTEVHAYRIGITPKHSIPSFIFFDKEGNGRCRPNMGSDEKGIPYFGTIEDVK